MSQRIAIIIDCIPSYRKNFYERLVRHYQQNLHIYCQARMPGHSMELAHRNFQDNVRLVKFLSWKGDKLVFQWLPYSRLLKKYEIFVIYGNPRFPLTLLFAYLAKLLGKKVIIWAQYHTANANSSTEKLRHNLISWFDLFFVYNDSEVDLMKKWKTKAKCIVGMNNGLDQDAIETVKMGFDEAALADFRKQNGLDDRLVVLSCARLLKKNNFDFFIRCLPELRKLYPKVIWCLIGDGPEREGLEALAVSLSVSDLIKWQGAIYDEDKLAPWYLSSVIFVHPSGAGLSLNHAMGYGLPVITHDDFHSHMPEIYAVEDGWNGVLYVKDSIESFVDRFASVVTNRDTRDGMSTNALRTVRDKYNTKVMSERFVEAMNCASQ